MRIVYCLYQLHEIGGVERVTITKANALAMVPGNEVFIVVVDNVGKEVPFELSTAIHFIDMKINYSEDWNSHGTLVSTYLSYRKRKKCHEYRLARLLNDLSPDVVIVTGNTLMNMLVSMKNRHWRLIRELHEERDFYVKHSRTFIQREKARFIRFYYEHVALKKCDKIVVLSESEKQENWSGWDKMAVIPNPVSFKCKSPSTLTEKRIISVGRLDYLKNFSSLINIFNRVSKKHGEWRLEIYGDGPEMGALQQQVIRYGLHEKVKLPGFTNNILKAMTSSSMFVSTSLSEGFPLVLLEAEECGLPVLSFNCSNGPKDIIDESANGYLIPVGDEQLMANRICELIENPEKLYRMGKCAKEKAQCYQVETIIQKWCDLFSELLQEGRCH
jgi:glycosyltransferase involved in cell wall biosynthesis